METVTWADAYVGLMVRSPYGVMIELVETRDGWWRARYCDHDAEMIISPQPLTTPIQVAHHTVGPADMVELIELCKTRLGAAELEAGAAFYIFPMLEPGKALTEHVRRLPHAGVSLMEHDALHAAGLSHPIPHEHR